nr:MAG TPA: hypothetical protein [Caudoviricetes sp.]
METDDVFFLLCLLRITTFDTMKDFFHHSSQ